MGHKLLKIIRSPATFKLKIVLSSLDLEDRGNESVLAKKPTNKPRHMLLGKGDCILGHHCFPG